MKKKNLPKVKPAKPLGIVNPDAAGIDVGSAEIVVCVPSDRDEEFVRTFATFTCDLNNMARWLKKCGIVTVAMESTGVYWIPVYEILEQHAIEVHLINTRFLKRRKKTDVLDCQWLQQMHSYGLLSGSFRPSNEICQLRGITRVREGLIRSRAASIQRMQKAFHQMNIQLDNVISDITGETGLQIIRAIVGGNHDPVSLSSLRDRRCKNDHLTIQKSLQGNYRSEHIFALKTALSEYDFYTQQIRECDLELEALYRHLEDPDVVCQQSPNFRKLKHRKDDPPYDLQQRLYLFSGVDLTSIDGFGVTTAQTILTELGFRDLKEKFPTCKNFTSWLTLSPNNLISGGKILANQQLKVRNRVKQALCLAARSLRLHSGPLGVYFRRIQTVQGTAIAIMATAHKLARIIYHMLVNRTPYNPDLHKKINQQQNREKALKTLMKKAQVLGFNLLPIATEVS